MADIYINYGTNLQVMTYELMKEADIAAGLRPDMRIGIKPNLVVSRPADEGATTHPMKGLRPIRKLSRALYSIFGTPGYITYAYWKEPGWGTVRSRLSENAAILIWRINIMWN